jgi:group I intron endonuclease
MLVYKITNTVNDRVYVGLTTGPLRVRWQQHLSAAKTDVDKPLYRAMRKHGVDKFAAEVIYEATSIEDLRTAEIRLIDELKAHAKDGGYNLTDHGHKHGTVDQQKGEDLYNAKLTEEMVAFIRDPAHWDTPNSVVLEMVQERFTRKQPMTEERKAQAKRTLDTHRQAAQSKLAEMRRGKRGLNAKLSEQTVKDIFYSPLSLLKTATQFGVSKKMVLLIKQRKAHVYLTKEL